jgi:hypothetical protein
MSSWFVSEPEPDDLMAVADAVDVTRPRRHPEADAHVLIHPMHRGELADVALEQMLAAWSYAVVDIDLVDLPIDLVPARPVAEHYECENDDCDTVLCLCNDGPCDDNTEQQACQHHELLCADHRLDCPDCLDDFRSDGL